jgi:histidyl-tRNA synthetase
MSQSTRPARGMRDFLPQDVRRRAYAIAIVEEVFRRYGFEPLETPALENIETLTGKYGEEGSKLIFKVLRRGEHEASGEADLALRYDLTVPLARVVAEHRGRLPKFFKRYQIQPVWRADRPARGRFREFYQCDIDALGTTSPAVEAEQCAAVSDVLEALGFGDFVLRLNHRCVLTAILAAAAIPEPLHGSALVAVDKLDKIGPAGVRAEMEARGIAADAASALLDRFEAWHGCAPGDLVGGGLDAAGDAALRNLDAIVRLADGTRAGRHIRFDPGLARGLSYYTGAIMEIAVGDLPGSLGGGGRYDDLVGMFLGQAVPACGFSLGLERILVVMSERGMFPATLSSAPADVMMAVFDAADMPHAMRFAARLRADGLRVLVYPDADKIGRQIKYADARGIPYVAILGGDEIAAGTVTVKDLVARTQHTWDQGAAGAAIREGLTHRG